MGMTGETDEPQWAGPRPGPQPRGNAVIGPGRSHRAVVADWAFHVAPRRPGHNRRVEGRRRRIRRLAAGPSSPNVHAATDDVDAGRPARARALGPASTSSAQRRGSTGGSKLSPWMLNGRDLIGDRPADLTASFWSLARGGAASCCERSAGRHRPTSPRNRPARRQPTAPCPNSAANAPGVIAFTKSLAKEGANPRGNSSEREIAPRLFIGNRHG